VNRSVRLKDMMKNKKSGWQLFKGGPDAYEKFIAPDFGGVWAQDIVVPGCFCN
jgi:hypothetical protein